MLIDWFTVIAQAINFLVLVWLMKRFLYKPVLSAIDARESGIAAKIADADAKIADAQKEQEDFRHKNEALDEQRADLLRKATTDADAERERLLGAARKDADAVRSAWQDALRNEQRGLGDEIVRRTRQGVFDIARKTLTELATASLEECITDVFIACLRGLGRTERGGFVASITASASPQLALIRSAFDLPPAQRAAIEAAVSETFAVQPLLRFETDPDLVSGIELTTNGQKVAWSIADYLETLEKDIGALVDEKTKTVVKPAADPKPDAAKAPSAHYAKTAVPLVTR